jgi:glyoxylase-like metal-dependent hydrolase (beta-lactamase superfamily II)
MLFTSTGKIGKYLHIAGLSTFPVHVMETERPVLFDAGATCAGELYVRGIKDILGDRQPEILFISHVHWDHCGAASILKKAFPSLKIATSRQASEILKRKSATDLMRSLNHEALEIMKSFPSIDPLSLIEAEFESFEVDMIIHDGQIIDLGGGVSLEVLATPGHTRDHLSFYFPGERILLAGDSAGMLDSSHGSIIAEFISDYDNYFSTIRRLASLPVEIFSQGHRIVFVGEEEVRNFFEQTIQETLRFRDQVCELLETEKPDETEVVRKIKMKQYDSLPMPKQPELIYLINLKAQVAHLAAKGSRKNT